MTAFSKYRNTLNLPQTTFPMKADLPKREPIQVKKWEKDKTYQKILKKNAKRPLFTLHDGPPYANGHIHYGHILNKVLKDIVIKYKNLAGWKAPFIPGWDCHGLPIEHQVEKELQEAGGDWDVAKIRQACGSYAEKYMDIQGREFKRLGIFADWERPYHTMEPSYEGTVARQLSQMVQKGMVYRGMKPVHWSTACKTALAEAEIEYRPHRAPSIFVKFSAVGDLSNLHPDFSGKSLHFVIWTTTPWTLPANQAIAVHEKFTYVALEVGEDILLVAEGLLESLRSSLNFQEDRLVDRIPGKKLEGIRVQHPFLDREVPVVLAKHVTLDMGTGIVHIAPGHGQEDYEVGQRYKLPVLSPVDEEGRFTADCGIAEWVGQGVFASNESIINLLRKKGALLKEEELEHAYPYCWRSKTPLIFRATPQYFLSLEEQDLKGRALDAIRRVEWIPSWGRDRIYSMVESRPDWCLSRQRAWGVPLMAFLCGNCGHSLLDGKVMEHIATLIEKNGSNIFFEKSAKDLLPKGIHCAKCGEQSWEKETDILDVWFESGSSWAAVLKESASLGFPADLYLEGSDQHRGWFHSSLFVALANKDKAPYQKVLTHGFVVDGEGKKFSKSAKNYLPPEKILESLGAEILRLWASSEDYRQDIRFSEEILDRLKESYRKIRNTFRFLLGNLTDFDPANHLVPLSKREPMDRWILGELAQSEKNWRQAYENYAFHTLYQSFHHVFSVTLSATYLNILKDRLYTFPADSPKRRSAQSSLFELTRAILPFLAPILSFTAEEVWTHLPPWTKKPSSVFLTDLSKFPGEGEDPSLRESMGKIFQVREEALKVLELAKVKGILRHPLEAQLRIRAEGDWMKFLQGQDKYWPEYLQVSQVVVSYELEKPAWKSEKIPGMQFEVRKAEGKKCERCWHYSLTVGRVKTHPDLCQRCSEILANL